MSQGFERDPGLLALARSAKLRPKLMIRSQLIAQLAKENPHLVKEDVERVVEVILDSVTQALVAGGRVELRGFGAFSVRERPARIGRNPRTGASVAVAAKSAPFFKSGKELRTRLNAGEDI